MAKYLLVSFKTCPWVQRAAIVLREKNIEFEFRHIDRDNRPDWFLAISPHKKVPVLRIDDKVSLFESNAINEYLDETIAPRLHPGRSGAARGQPRLDRLSADLLRDGDRRQAYADDEAEYKEDIAQNPAWRSSSSKARWRSKARGAVLQRREILAGRCRLCAVPAALLSILDRIKPLGVIEKFPRREGLGGGAAQAALDAFVPRGRVRGDLPG